MLPPQTLNPKGYWITGGQCKGMHSDGIESIKQSATHLTPYTKKLLTNTETKYHLHKLYETRKLSHTLYPQQKQTQKYLTYTQTKSYNKEVQHYQT